MHISKFQLFNYKSFQDSGLLEFTQGINIIVGQNNAGKTALLEALTLNFGDVPHRSIKTLKTPLSTLDNTLSKSKIYIYLEKKELRLMIDQYLPLIIPMEANGEQAEKTVNKFIEWMNQDNDVKFLVSLSSNNVIDVANTDLTFGIYSHTTQVTGSKNGENTYYSINVKQTVSDELKLYSITQYARPSEIIAGKLFRLLQSRIYRFYAERLNISKCAFGNQSILAPNASNLAEVLNSLQSRNSENFNDYNKYINQIFSHIQRIAVEPRDNNQLEIMVWNIDPKSKREDLAVSLSSCGTGIG